MQRIKLSDFAYREYARLVPEKLQAGDIQLQYNPATNTLSGSIIDFVHPFGLYLPYFLPGSPVAQVEENYTALYNGGSFRKYTIRFNNIRSKQ